MNFLMKQKLISLCLLPILAFGHWALDFDEDFAADSAAAVIVYEPESNFTYTVAANKATITGYSGPGGQLNIPPTLGGYPVTEIGNLAFYLNDSITGVNIPSGVVIIGIFSFNACPSLVSVLMPESLTSIGREAFGSSGITSATIPNNVNTIANDVFFGCRSLLSVSFPSSCGYIPPQVCKNCVKLLNILIPEGVTNIGNSAFGDCILLSIIKIPTNVVKIGDYAFRSCIGVTGYYFSGDAPNTMGTEVFGNNGNPTLYRRVGNVGWPNIPNTFGGIPTAIWTNYPNIP